ncbi:MAG TPA: protocatechuate 3,4-dioxygenase subunit alpha [Candidatus Angelobacter sp.]|nr:protocatechuate 3,4-dioxygenase subunit alpha [Candidatus Angelobacter sp.]
MLPTPSQTVGPFFQVGLTAEAHCIRLIAGRKAKGERIWLACQVLDGEGSPVPDAMIEIWQADAAGQYPAPENGGADPECSGFGRLPTDEEGRCEFESVRPGRVEGPGGVQQTPHFVVAVFARGLLKQLFTRVYFAGEAANQEDPVLALVPAKRRETLMAQPDPLRPGHWRFDVRLQGDKETVFFDV